MFMVNFNSPRFDEARLRCGILKEELEIKTEEDFFESGTSEEIQRVRFNHFQKKRRDKMALVLEMRDSLLKEMELKQRAKQTSKSATLEEIDLLGKEQANLEKLKVRQKQDIAQIVAYEIHMSEIHSANQDREKQEAKLELNRQRDRKKRLKNEELRRVKYEEEKQARIKEEEHQRRIMTERNGRLAKRQAEADEEKAAQLKREARQKDAEREAKRKQCELETQKLFDAQAALVREKAQNMEIRDATRELEQELKQQQMAEEYAAKLKRQQLRVDVARQYQEQLKLEQKMELERKQNIAKERQEIFLREKGATRKSLMEKSRAKMEEIQKIKLEMERRIAHKRERAEEAQKRVNTRLSSKQQQEYEEQKQRMQESEQTNINRKAAYEAKNKKLLEASKLFEEKQRRQQKSAARKAAALQSTDAIKDEVARLREQDRQDALERKRRMDEYNRERMIEKVKLQENRMEHIKAQREEVSKLRAQQRLQAELEKKAVMSAFETFRCTGKLEMPDGIEDLVPPFESPVVRTRQKLPRKITRPATASGARYMSPPRCMPTATSSPVKSLPGTSNRPKTASCCKTSTLVIIDESPKPRPQSSFGAKRMKKEKTVNTSRNDLMAKIEKLRRQQNEYLLKILEEEQAEESRREGMIKKARTPVDKKRYSRLFNVERSQASNRILRITEEHQVVMNALTEKLNSFKF